jgi:hypothetical protein
METGKKGKVAYSLGCPGVGLTTPSHFALHAPTRALYVPLGALHTQTGERNPMHVKGMVQVAGVTYRIVRIERGTYDVVRILDDQRVGQFRTIPRVEVTASVSTDETIAEVAKAAVKWGKTSWVGRLSFA